MSGQSKSFSALNILIIKSWKMKLQVLIQFKHAKTGRDYSEGKWGKGRMNFLQGEL